ncbi:MAG: hypothetical protein C0622_10845 [Desulfuromonas sp.]|nr:MAG: hypothetical protein C0622_10845 [Desulfuromonas sp.]
METAGYLKFQDSGRGPAVVLLHDALLNADSWKEQAAELVEAGFRVIVPELSGLPGSGNLADYRAAIIAMLNRLGVGRFAVCGMGMGGSVLLALLERYQERIVGACMINTRPGADDVHERYRRAELISAIGTDKEADARNDLLQMLMCGREESLNEDVRAELRKMVFGLDKKNLLFNLRAMQQRKNYSALLEKIKVPVLLMAGQYDQICHPGYSAIMADCLPNCRGLINFEGGHLVHLEKSAAATNRLLDFMRTIAPRRAKLYAFPSLNAA